MTRNVHLHIYEGACERRELDAQKVHSFFSRNRWTIVSRPQDADTIIFFSCGIIENATLACIEYIKHCRRYGAELIVAGCGPAIDLERIRAVHSGRVISTRELDNLDALFPGESCPFSAIEDAASRYSTLRQALFSRGALRFIQSVPGIRSIFTTVLKRALLVLFGRYSFIYIKVIGLEGEYYSKVAEGCLGACAYCALPPAIGPLRSKPLEECIRECAKGLDKGCRNIFITADDTGAYGADIGVTIVDLLNAISGFDNEYAILVSSLNPVWAVRHLDGIVEAVAKGRIACLVIPVQSGTPRILALMNRFAGTEQIRRAVRTLRQSSPSLWISTHVLAGFPSETEEEFRQTLEYVMDVPFNEVQVFAYSMKQSTPAEHIEPRVPGSVIAQRMKTARVFFADRKCRCVSYRNDFLYAVKPRSRWAA